MARQIDHCAIPSSCLEYPDLATYGVRTISFKRRNAKSCAGDFFEVADHRSASTIRAPQGAKREPSARANRINRRSENRPTALYPAENPRSICQEPSQIEMAPSR
jgi:hypothetical protein